MLASRACTITATKPMEKVMCASTMDSRPRVRLSIWMKSSSSDTPSNISGMATGASTMNVSALSL